jgi:hypothetical protein
VTRPQMGRVALGSTCGAIKAWSCVGMGEPAEGKRPTECRLRLARFFGASPEFWVNLQAMHDLTKARLERGGTIARDVHPRAA